MRRFGARKVWLGGGILGVVGAISLAAAPAVPLDDASGASVAALAEPVDGEIMEASPAARESTAETGAEPALASAAPMAAPEAGTETAGMETTEAADAEAVLETQVGSASYYANMLAGRPTASGIPYDPSAPVAAHRKLPFGTRLRVHNLANGRTVEVEVVDRGPFAKGRILDLSRSAAKELDFIRAGHTRVRIEVLEYGG